MAEEKEKKEYIVREGRTFGVNATPAGESVWLTEEEAASVLDLVEPAEKPKKGSKATDPNEDTRDEATNERNIGNKAGDAGTPREAPSARKK